MPVDETIECTVGDYSLEPETCLHTFLAEDRINLCIQGSAFDSKGNDVANLKAELLRLAVFKGKSRHIGLCLRPPLTVHHGNVVDVVGRITEIVLVLRGIATLFGAEMLHLVYRLSR